MWRRASLGFIHSVFTMASSVAVTSSDCVRLFLCGDVMLGRGVDQILAKSVDPRIYESYVKDARSYVELAVNRNGVLPVNRSVQYVWGDAIRVFEQFAPDVRIINLETAVTDHNSPWPHKGINYRMHPENVDVIQSARIDCCVLSNNHVLDWGYEGLTQTLSTLKNAGIRVVGAGADLDEAESPAIFEIDKRGGGSLLGRVLVFGIGTPTSGVPRQWAASGSRSGVVYVDWPPSKQATDRLKANIVRHKRGSNDIVVVSIHWGSNWGWEMDSGSQTFAHRLIDDCGVDIVHGHSSHHIRPIEIYHDKLIAYGCGDFISDYEGISGSDYQDRFRDDLSLMYFVDVNMTNGKLINLHLVPMRLRELSVHRAHDTDEKWLYDNMRRQSLKYGVNVSRVGTPGAGDTYFNVAL